MRSLARQDLPFSLPSGVRVEPSIFGGLILARGGVMLGELHDSGSRDLATGMWSWNDSIMEFRWMDNISTLKMASWLRVRCSEAYPEEEIRMLWTQFRKVWKDCGRYSPAAVKAHARIADLISAVN